ncbi:MAG: hypothetical protein AB7V26_07625 [Lysobacterales bacterium]
MALARSLRACLLLLLPLAMPVVLAQPVAGPGYQLRAIDGDNDLGEHFAIAGAPGLNAVGFFYVADQGRLITSTCAGLTCNGANAPGFTGLDRGRHVSAAIRSGLGNRPFAAYYDASNGDLIGLDCQNADCSFGIERVLDSVGNVGQDTAVAIDPVTGLPLIAYYDVDNGDLRLYRCATAICDSGVSGLVNSTNDRGHNVSMVFAGSTLWLGYEDRTTGDLVLARTTTPYTVFAFFGQTGGVEPALSADASGFLDMVWRETSGNSLQRLQCLNSSCTSASQSTLAGAGQGYRPSATRLPSGNLLVSHFAPGSGTLLGSLCPDPACASPQALVFDSAAALTGKSVMRTTSGLPLVFYQDLARADVRSSQCTTAACSAFTRRVALNGLPVNGARIALRPDGRAMIAYIRERRPWLAHCNDALCSSLTRTVLPGLNSDTRPAVAVRPNGRPFGYYSSVGGSEAYDCADALCALGSSRAVSGSGNSTGDVLEIALRTDGRPVLLYAVSNLNDVYLFDCADGDCSSGTAHLLVDEPTGNGTFLWNYAIIVGPGDRPIVMYALGSNSGPALRYVRCNDSACNAATLSTVGSSATFFATPLALRSDARPVFLEQGPNNLAICDNADCTGLARFPIGFGGISRSLALLSGDRPVFEVGSVGFGGLNWCDDASCSTAQSRLLLSDGNAQSSYQGSLALNAAGAAFVAFEESSLADVLLAVPLPDAVFKNGFE